MINLLPPEEKKNISYKRIEKLIVIISLMFFVFIICFSIILFTIKTYTSSQLESERINFNQINEKYASVEIRTSQEMINKYNKKFSDIKLFYENQINFSESIEKISKLKPKEINFNNLSLKKSPQGIIFSISGFSQTRISLIDFRRILEDDPRINNVHFSPLVWAKPENINFQLTFELKNE